MKILDNESQSQAYQDMRLRGLQMLTVILSSLVWVAATAVVCGPIALSGVAWIALSLYVAREMVNCALSDIYILEREADFLEKVANDSIPYVQQFRDRRPIQVKK